MAVEQPKSEPRRNKIPLWLGFGISGVWLAFFVIFWLRNFSEVATLGPNNLGDFLAGVFAPLAFLWLFVATLLQRQELELQRQELTETREVLNLQKEEMKRAADENREQTRIMTENLRADAERKLYNEIDTRLYSLALYVVANRSTAAINFAEGGSRRLANIDDYLAGNIN